MSLMAEKEGAFSEKGQISFCEPVRARTVVNSSNSRNLSVLLFQLMSDWMDNENSRHTPSQPLMSSKLIAVSKASEASSNQVAQ